MSIEKNVIKNKQKQKKLGVVKMFEIVFIFILKHVNCNTNS